MGSFLATVVLRAGSGTSALTGGSHCDACGKRLGAFEMVPIISYVALRGACRSCGGRIDPHHLAIECATAVLTATAMVIDPLAAALATAVLAWLLLPLGALDAQHRWLPDWLTLPLLLLGLAVAAWGIGPPIADRIIGAVAGFASLALIGIAYRHLRGRDGIGSGDPKLFAAIGAWVGWQMLPFLLLAGGIAGLLSVLLAHVRGRPISRDEPLPLGTFLVIAAWPIWIVLIAGNR